MKSSKKYLSPLYPFLFGWALILYSSSFSDLGLINGLGQLLLFTLVVCIPIWRTERMSYVDIGWPWGLVLLGEFPRYQYQRRRWEKNGKTNVQLALQVDAISQGLANASFLALPVFIIASNTSSKLSGFELVGLIIWALAFVMETLADIQKLAFLQEMKKQGKQRQVCNVGLWRFCRHPNYFAEWMVWNGLIIAAIPSWWALQSAESTLIWGLIGAGLLFTSRMMYSTLVYLTGAVPSEYYSAQKRPDYITYQQRTNRFFPGPPRE